MRGNCARSAPTPATHCQLPEASAGASSISNRSQASRPDAPVDAEIEAEERRRNRTDARMHPARRAQVRARPHRRADSPSGLRTTRRAPGCVAANGKPRMRACNAASGVSSKNHANCRKKSRSASARSSARSETRSSASRNGSRARASIRSSTVRAEATPKARAPPTDATSACPRHVARGLIGERRAREVPFESREGARRLRNVVAGQRGRAEFGGGGQRLRCRRIRDERACVLQRRARQCRTTPRDTGRARDSRVRRRTRAPRRCRRARRPVRRGRSSHARPLPRARIAARVRAVARRHRSSPSTSPPWRRVRARVARARPAARRAGTSSRVPAAWSAAARDETAPQIVCGAAGICGEARRVRPGRLRSAEAPVRSRAASASPAWSRTRRSRRNRKMLSGVLQALDVRRDVGDVAFGKRSGVELGHRRLRILYPRDGRRVVLARFLSLERWPDAAADACGAVTTRTILREDRAAVFRVAGGDDGRIPALSFRMSRYP